LLFETKPMETVACITTYFNPVQYRTRRDNHALFAESLAAQGVSLLTVELALGDDPFELPASPTVCQLRGRSRLWMKERLINAAVARLPAHCTAFAWVDGDLLFADRSWFSRLVEQLETDDIVQLFERVVHLPPGHRGYQGESLGDDTGVVAQATQVPDWLAQRRARKLPFAVPGYAWAARRTLFAQAGLYDRSILGNGDAILADCLFDSFGIYHYTSMLNAAMADDMNEWRRRTFDGGPFRVGYLPVEIHHLWHGSFDNRRYTARDEILLRHDFDPRADLILAGDVYEWASEKPELHAEVADYFSLRREDDE
jgi:hypothetical protein